MGKEIERRFLIKSDDWMNDIEEILVYRQGYLSRDPHRTVRVRYVSNKPTSELTIKGLSEIIDGALNTPEFNYPIPSDEALELFGLCVPPILEKNRHIVTYEGYKWEIDVFITPDHEAIAEIETADVEFPIPSWCGEEITTNPRYRNIMIGLTEAEKDELMLQGIDTGV